MPEFPEVATIISYLKDSGLLNQTINDVIINLEKIFKNCSSKQFKNFIINEKIKDISQIGKYLIFHLTNQKVFIVHLRMEGKLFFENKNDPYNKNHTLVRIKINNNELRYIDTRRFGTFNIYQESDYLNAKEIKKIGLDPLNKLCDWIYFKNKMSTSNRFIKTVLLDQTKVSGIGNIYADEILFAAKIHPLTKANSLTNNDFLNLQIQAKNIISLAIKNKGTTISTYFYKNEHKGEFQKYLKVHQKKDQKCLICDSIITKIKVNNRGTYLCNHCQKIKTNK